MGVTSCSSSVRLRPVSFPDLLRGEGGGWPGNEARPVPEQTPQIRILHLLSLLRVSELANTLRENKPTLCQ